MYKDSMNNLKNQDWRREKKRHTRKEIKKGETDKAKVRNKET